MTPPVDGAVQMPLEKRVMSSRAAVSAPAKVGHLIYSHAIGGSETCAAEICTHLNREWFSPAVVFMFAPEGPMPGLLDSRGVTHRDVNFTRLKKLLGPVFPSLAIRRMGLDILHVHHVPLLRMIYPFRKHLGLKKLVLTEHAVYSISRFAAFQRFARKMQAGIDAFTTVSEGVKNYFVERLGLDGAGIQVIPNGVDVARFRDLRDAEARRQLVSEGDESFMLITVGRLAEAKDFPILLRAVKIAREDGAPVRLALVGDGEMRDELSRMVRELGLEKAVNLMGRRVDIERLLCGADAFVMSSKREGLPMALLEAMASGLPIAATRAGGIPEVVRDGQDGLLVDCEDPVQLAGAIQRLCHDGDLRTRLGKAARKSAESTFSFVNIARQYENIYHGLLGQEISP